MISNKFLNHISKRLPQARILANSQVRSNLNHNFINCRRFGSTPPNRFIASSASIVTTAHIALLGGSIALPLSLASKSSRSSIKIIKILSALSVVGSLIVLGSKVETNPYTGKNRLLFSDLESERKTADLKELDILKNCDIISEVDPAIKQNIDNILSKLRNSSGEEVVSFEQAPKWYLVDSEESTAFGLLNGTIFIKKGLLSHMENSDQLAFYLAKTLSHQLCRHSTENFSINTILTNLTLLGVLSFNLLTPYVTPGIALLVVKYPIKFAFVRDQEREADNLAYLLTARSGYNPLEFKLYLDKLESNQSSIEDQSKLPEFIIRSELLTNLWLNTQYYLFSDELTNTERANNIKKLADINNDLFQC